MSQKPRTTIREKKRQKHKMNGEVEGKWNEKTYGGG